MNNLKVIDVEYLRADRTIEPAPASLFNSCGLFGGVPPPIILCVYYVSIVPMW